ncbi:MAG: hypothetical protein ACYSWX_01525 [Planctomycetota bacterium]|jgi:hypothetical protein
MRKFKGTVAAEATGGNEKAKILIMIVGLLLVGAAFVMSVKSGKDAGDRTGEVGPVGAGQVVLPTLLPGTLEAFADGTEEERVLVERQPLEVLLGYVRLLTSAHVELLEPSRLDEDTIAGLLADPDARRGDFFSVRGELIALSESRPAGGGERWQASLSLDSGALVHVITPRLDDGLAVGDWARVDGLFTKLLTEPLEGDWRTAPLLVGPRLVRSYPDFGEVTSISEEVWAAVEDDTLEETRGSDDAIRWRALAWTRDTPYDATLWDEAQELDAATMERILVDPAAHRGQRFRLPVGLTHTMTVRKAGENPGRIDEYTEGYLFNTTWSDRTPFLTFIAPGDQLNGIRNGRTRRVTGDFVFLRNFSFVTAANTRRVGSLFVAASFEPFVDPDPYGLWQIAIGFLSFGVALATLIIVLWRRDQKRAKALQEKLIERRRARRARASSA